MDMNYGRGGGLAGRRGLKGRKKWDNCNSIINKIYLKTLSRKSTGTYLDFRNNEFE